MVVEPEFPKGSGMTSLLVFKEYLKKFYAKNEVFIMLVRKIVKAAFYCGIGLVVGKTISSQKHKNDVKKILSANYMDDRTKVELMQDLNGIKVDHKKDKKIQKSFKENP